MIDFGGSEQKLLFWGDIMPRGCKVLLISTNDVCLLFCLFLLCFYVFFLPRNFGEMVLNVNIIVRVECPDF